MKSWMRHGLCKKMSFFVETFWREKVFKTAHLLNDQKIMVKHCIGLEKSNQEKIHEVQAKFPRVVHP